jgi:hypothetical protein
MFGRKRVLRVVSVLSVALAAGHLVESLRASAVTRDAGTLDSLARSEGVADLPGTALPNSASLTAGGFGDLPPLMGITSVASAPDLRGDLPCSPALSLAASADAMIDLALVAPCNLGQRVVIRHSGLSFTAQTGADGRLSLRLPALESDALVTAYFEGSEMAIAKVEVPGLEKLVRFGFQAPFPLQFDLRADVAGQVYSGRVASAARDGSRKILTLGAVDVSQPMLAQVYTFPEADPGTADLTVELRITSETCSRTFQAETILSQDGVATLNGLPIAVPLCGTSGDILVLKNLVSDPTLAASN